VYRARCERVIAALRASASEANFEVTATKLNVAVDSPAYRIYTCVHGRPKWAIIIRLSPGSRGHGPTTTNTLQLLNDRADWRALLQVLCTCSHALYVFETDCGNYVKWLFPKGFIEQLVGNMIESTHPDGMVGSIYIQIPLNSGIDCVSTMRAMEGPNVRPCPRAGMGYKWEVTNRHHQSTGISFEVMVTCPDWNSEGVFGFGTVKRTTATTTMQKNQTTQHLCSVFQCDW